MASTYSDRLKLELMEAGANAGIWGNNTNDNLQVIDAAVGGYLTKNVSGSTNVTLTQANRDPDVETTNESANKVIEFTGTLTGNIYVFVPAVEKEYIFHNNTSGSYTLTVAPTGHTANGVAVSQGAHTIMYNKNGNEMVDLFANSLGTLSADTINATTYTGDGSSLTGIQPFTSGTKMLFQQTSAPTGWTKDTTHNNKALRVVTGTASSGGSNTFSGAFNTAQTVSGTSGGTSVTITGSTAGHVLTQAQLPSYTLTPSQRAKTEDKGTLNRGSSSGGGASYEYLDIPSGGSDQAHSHGVGTLAGSSHTHTFSDDFNLDVQYVDLIIASKD